MSKDLHKGKPSLSLWFQIARNLRTVLDRGFTEFDLRAQQAGTLARVSFHEGAASPSGLAIMMGTDSAGISGLIDHLEKKKLVIRKANPLDRRSITIELTENGKALLPSILPVFRDANEKLLTGFSNDEIVSLENMLLRVHDNVIKQLGAA